MTDNERELVRRAQKGDQNAFAQLYNTYMQPIYRYIYFKVSLAADAEDLTEEVFIRAWDALPNYVHGKHPFKSWLYRIAHNLVIDHRRKAKPISVDPMDLLHLKSEKLSAEQTIENQEMAGKLLKAIAQLDKTEQQIIMLRFVEELSHRDVADILDITEGSSRVMQHRVLKKLRDLLKKDGVFNA